MHSWMTMPGTQGLWTTPAGPSCIAPDMTTVNVGCAYAPAWCSFLEPWSQDNLNISPGSLSTLQEAACMGFAGGASGRVDLEWAALAATLVKWACNPHLLTPRRPRFTSGSQTTTEVTPLATPGGSVDSTAAAAAFQALLQSPLHRRAPTVSVLCPTLMHMVASEAPPCAWPACWTVCLLGGVLFVCATCMARA